MDLQPWRALGNCAGMDIELADPIFFVGRGKSANPARALCGSCPVQSDCLEFAILYDEQGFWGGTTDEERKALAPKLRPLLETQARLAGRLEARRLDDPIVPQESFQDSMLIPIQPMPLYGSDPNSNLPMVG